MQIKAKVAAAATMLGGVLVSSVAVAVPAQAHGYVSEPFSRASACAQGLNNQCGSIVYEPQSLEGPKGFPEGGPADGKIASAGGLFGGVLDQQTDQRWYKNDITAGPLAISWNFTAPHKTSGWSYYMTKSGWDPNAALTRAELEPIGRVEHDGSPASNNPTHVVNVPGDRSGYHVILAVWDIADTTNAFYQVMDVNVDGQADPDAEGPSAPTNLAARNVTASAASLAWTASQDNVGVSQYQLFRDGKLVGTSTVPEYSDSGLRTDTTYTYVVRATDAAGNVSQESEPLTVTTAAAPAVDDQAPSAPEYLHSMGMTESTASLMWRASTDNVGVDHYLVFRNGEQVGRSNNTMFMDTGLNSANTYQYTVRAVDAAGNMSGASNQLVVTTSGQPDATKWDSRTAYRTGDRVSFNGVTYECIQSYRGYGDPNWIYAPSLWKQV